MHRVYQSQTQRSTKHLQSYLQHKVEDRRDLADNETPRPRPTEASLFGNHRPLQSGGKSSKLASSPAYKRPTTPTILGSNGFLNVYQRSTSNSPMQSLERKNPEKRVLRAQIITDGLKKIRERRNIQDIENQSPNRQRPTSRGSPPGSLSKKQSPALFKNSFYQPEIKSSRPNPNDFYSVNSQQRTINSIAKRQSPKAELKSALKTTPRRNPFTESTINSKMRPSQSRLNSDHGSETSEYCKSDHSEGRTSQSRSIKSRGLSMTRDDSIERKLDTYMKNRKVASRTAVRLNANTLFNLDTILWKVTTTHHVN